MKLLAAGNMSVVKGLRTLESVLPGDDVARSRLMIASACCTGCLFNRFRGFVPQAKRAVEHRADRRQHIAKTETAMSSSARVNPRVRDRLA